jgi:hypothetical protein
MGTSEVQLRNEAQAQRARMTDTLEAIGDRVSPERMVERRKAAIGQSFKRARDTVMGSRDYEEPKLARVKDQASGAVHAAGEHMQQAPEMLANQVRGNPLAAGVVMFGAGVLVASMFPETRAEKRVVGAAQPQIHNATEGLKEAGRELAGDMKQHGQEAAEELRTAGTDAVANVKEQTQESAQLVQQDLRR